LSFPGCEKALLSGSPPYSTIDTELKLIVIFDGTEEPSAGNGPELANVTSAKFNYE
jgi:hypothetical protein